MRRGNRHANSSEAARADANEDGIGNAAVQHVADHRNESFGVSAADQLVPPGDARTNAVEQGGGTGGARCVERKKHGPDSGHMRPNAARPQTASTDSTSGT